MGFNAEVAFCAFGFLRPTRWKQGEINQTCWSQEIVSYNGVERSETAVAALQTLQTREHQYHHRWSEVFSKVYRGGTVSAQISVQMARRKLISLNPKSLNRASKMSFVEKFHEVQKGS